MRLIDSDALVNPLKLQADSFRRIGEWVRADALDDCIVEIGEQPTVDAEPVVRCKQCRQWDDSSEWRYVGGWCFCERLQVSTSPDFFCADGERKNAPTCGPDYCEIGGEDNADG